jgi:rhodanese-related sulfurtransferase
VSQWRELKEIKMTFPLQSFLAVSTSHPWTYLIFGLIGFAFGFTLEMSGFGNSRKLAAQFYLTDLTVLKVMFTAIVTALVLLFGAVGLGLLDFGQVWVNPTYLSSGILGGLIMGVGFIVGGFCPTTSLAAASTGKLDGMFFVAGGFFGAFLFGETEKYFTDWYNNAGYYGRLTLDQVFHLPTGVVVTLIVLMALFMFWGAEQLERVFGKKDLSKEPKLRVAGAAVLVALAVGVIIIGTPSLSEKYARVTFTREVNGQQVTVSASEVLAKREVQIVPAELFKSIYNQQLNLIMLDVRPESDYNLYHINGALNIPLDKLPSIIPDLLTEPPANSVFVLMSNDETAATEAWKQLVASSVKNVYILEGGINNWIAFFGNEENFQSASKMGDDQLDYIFPAALGSKYESCDPNPIQYEDLEFAAKIKLELNRDNSGGGCG